MRTKSTQQEWVENFLSNLPDDELLTIHNDYNDGGDDQIYNNDEEFFETFFSGKVMDAVRAVAFGEYKFNHNYVRFNGYANLESFDYVSDHVDIEELAAWVLDNTEKMSEYDMDDFEAAMEDAFVEYAEGEGFDEETAREFIDSEGIDHFRDFSEIIPELKKWYDNKKAEEAEGEEEVEE